MITNIEAGVPKGQQGIPWLNKQFVRAEDLFPDWPEARDELHRFCRETSWWIVHFEAQRKIKCSLLFSSGPLNGKMRPLWERWPSQRAAQVKEIIQTVIRDYWPDLAEFSTSKKDPDEKMKKEILLAFSRHEARLIKGGAQDVLGELAFRLGVSPFGRPTQ